MSKNSIVSLAKLDTNRSGKVVKFTAGPGLVRRLEEMGIRAGKRITKISGMPLRGPVVIQVGGTRIALGHGMAMKVMVELSASR
ncbi:MAG TPA: ferrous iron transport protein A [Proteobacteria bacterium]|nr:ferrous iron transport protein A [Pseudomonadota bacterium]